MFERIKPKTPEAALIRCSATRPRYKWRNEKPGRHPCARFAVAIIDGQPLCMAHAGPVALDKLAAIQEAADNGKA